MHWRNIRVTEIMEVASYFSRCLNLNWWFLQKFILLVKIVLFTFNLGQMSNVNERRQRNFYGN